MSNEELNAQLSALMDDELRKDETLFLARRLMHDADAVAQLGRYYMIGDAIRRQLPDVVDTRLAARVSAALDAEPALQVASGVSAKRFLRPLAGLGVAASVAMVAVNYWGSQEPTAGEPTFVAAGTQPVQSSSLLTTSSQLQPQNQWNRLDPEVQKRLQGYLVNHSEHAATGQLGGVLNYVRMAGQQQEARD